MTHTVSAYVYLQPMDAGERLLVKRSDFGVTKDTKPNWFFKHLVQRPCEPYDDTDPDVPVIYVGVPKLVLCELVACAINPARAKRATKAVPVTLKDTLDLPSWVETMERFNLEELDETPLSTGPDAKRIKRGLPAWFPTVAQIRQCARAGAFLTATSG